MKKFFQIFFMTLGVIFAILILGVVYLLVADPFDIKPMLQNLSGETVSVDSEQGSAVSDKNPLLNESQEKTLEKIGVDPATLPTTITPEMEACAVEKLGASRVEEIKNGASPSFLDFLSARSCF